MAYYEKESVLAVIESVFWPTTILKIVKKMHTAFI